MLKCRLERCDKCSRGMQKCHPQLNAVCEYKDCVPCYTAHSIPQMQEKHKTV